MFLCRFFDELQLLERFRSRFARLASLRGQLQLHDLVLSETRLQPKFYQVGSTCTGVCRFLLVVSVVLLAQER